MALQALKDLENEVVTFAEQVGAPGFRLVGPRQFHGIEINPFARELASMVVWIGFLQWNRANGISNAQRPVLEPLQNIRLHDALMNEDGTEYEWPVAEFIIGNPPFLGDKVQLGALGDEYVQALRALYGRRIPGTSDLVCYWFEKARSQIAAGRAQRAGLIATAKIRQKGNRAVLERVKASGDVFLAWPDEPWTLDGAAVRVAIVGFDDGREQERLLAGRPVENIHADLQAALDTTRVHVLEANSGVSYVGIQKGGPFDIPGDLARSWLDLPNSSGKSNRDVLRRFIGAREIAQVERDVWIVDFGQLAMEQAVEYEAPFAYVEEQVRPGREGSRRSNHARYWWLHQEPRPGMRRALEELEHFIATPMVSKHRFFVWLPSAVAPSNKLVVIASDDTTLFGVLSSTAHRVWSERLGGRHGAGNDLVYQNRRCFETFAFPNATYDQREAVSAAARHLDEVRRHLLDADESLTLTKLYNEVVALRENRDAAARAFPLLLAHEALDAAVAAAYGWDWPLTDEEILERLLALNLERSAAEQAEG